MHALVYFTFAVGVTGTGVLLSSLSFLLHEIANRAEKASKKILFIDGFLPKVCKDLAILRFAGW
jgi:hypothetical protein